MPIKRRLEPTAPADLIDAFTWADDDTFTKGFSGEALFASQHEARCAWPECRRILWAQTPRFSLPRPSQVFDGLTLQSLQFVRWHWNLVGPFDLAGALAALAEDRAHLAAFQETGYGDTIADFLELFREDLDAIEAAARRLAAWPGEHWTREYPALTSTRTYGEVERPRGASA